MIRAALIWLALAAPGLACEAVTHRDRAFTICTADLERHAISLHLNGEDGVPLGSFAALERRVDGIAFAMNAGMYHQDRRPVGLYVEDGREAKSIVTREGPGNFGMLPNGVFCVADGRASVIESRTFAADPPACEQASQSGPMMVINGALHPRFIPESEFLNIRNGVGPSEDGRLVHFVISDEPVSFHEMATLFRDYLGVSNALYFDGRVSRLHAPALGRSDGGRAMGPIVAVTER